VPHRTGGSGVGGVWYPEAASSAQAPQPRETPPVFFEVRSVLPPNLMQGKDSGPAFEIPAGFSLEIPAGFSLESLLTSSCRLQLPDCEWLARPIANDVLDAPAFCLCFPFLFFSFASCCWLAGITSDVCFVFVFFCCSHRQLRIVVGSIAPLARHCLPYLYVYVVCECVCVCVCVCVYVCACVYLCMYVCMYISYIACIYIQTGIHTHTHTRTCTYYISLSRAPTGCACVHARVQVCVRKCTGMNLHTLCMHVHKTYIYICSKNKLGGKKGLSEALFLLFCVFLCAKMIISREKKRRWGGKGEKPE
jgi:hypothetical protein